MQKVDFISGRLWVKMMILMGTLPLVGSLIDYFSFVQGAFGTINNLSVIVMLALGLLYFMTRGQLTFENDRRMFFVGVLLAAAIGLRTFSSDENSIAGTVGTVMIFGAMMCGYSAYAVALRGVDVSRAVITVVIMSAVFAFAAPLMVSMSPDAYETYYFNVYGYSNVRVLGYFTGVSTVVCSMMLAWSGNSPKSGFRRMVMLWIVLMLNWSFLVWSGSRAAFISALLAVIISWCIVGFPSKKVMAAAAAALPVGAGLSQLYFHPSHHFGLISRARQTMESISTGDMTRITTNRSDLWLWAMERISESPWFGYGMYPMDHLRTPEFNFYHSHNIVLEYALGVGIPYMILISGTILGLYIVAAKAARASEDIFVKACFGMVTACLITAQFNAILFFPFYMTLFMSGLAGLVGLRRLHQPLH